MAEQGGGVAATATGAAGGHGNESRLAACATAYRDAPAPGAVSVTPETPAPTTTSGDTASPDESTPTRSPIPDETATNGSWSALVGLAGLFGAMLLLARRYRT
jgi:hypothetical protein